MAVLPGAGEETPAARSHGGRVANGPPSSFPVRVVDVASSSTYDALLVDDRGSFTLHTMLHPADPPALYLSPGWIDLHAHVYHGVTSLSLHPDAIGLATGVHLIADAGSAGEATLPGLLEYVIPSARTQVRVWLNISSVGLVTMREYYDLSVLDPERTAAAARANRPTVCGIKVRTSGLIVGELGLEPLKLGRLAARAAGLPLMVHVGEAPPLIEEVLDLLEAGDVVSHCYHGKFGGPWQPNGQPGPALLRALDRGVRLDVAHGAASFSFDVAERAIAAGYLPHSISTDLHIRNVRGPVFDLPTTMSKLLAVGMPLVDVVRAVTESPASVLGENGWCALDGELRHATLFRLVERGKENVACDATGEERLLDKWIEPVAVITPAGMEGLSA